VNIADLKKLLEFDAPTIANGMGLSGLRDPAAGYTGPDVRCLMPDFGPRIGIAVTSRLDTTTGGTETVTSMLPDWLALMKEAACCYGPEPMPVFAVMESVGPRPRHTVTIGDMMATRMVLAGSVAFISNGSIRDIEGVRGAGLPCWAAGLTPMHGRLRWLDVGSPVIIDGMTVRTGDFIFADINGAVVIPPEGIDKAYELAMEVKKREGAQFDAMKQPGHIDAFIAAGRTKK
jgi:4-hydroxy-4-methyl-2-oxoglutarate aldolase